MLERTTCTPEETRSLGAELGRLLLPGDLILLEGGLGAGKTTFVQGIAAGLGIASPVTSPTFTLIHEYPGGRLPLVHVDVYRLSDLPDRSNAADLPDIGFEDYLEGGSVVVVEWGERLGPLTPSVHLRVSIRPVPGQDARRMIELAPIGSRWEGALRLIGGPT